MRDDIEAGIQYLVASEHFVSAHLCSNELTHLLTIRLGIPRLHAPRNVDSLKALGSLASNNSMASLFNPNRMRSCSGGSRGSIHYRVLSSLMSCTMMAVFCLWMWYIFVLLLCCERVVLGGTA
jgi:hypothetical protein